MEESERKQERKIGRLEQSMELAIVGAIALVAGNIFDYKSIDDTLRTGGAFTVGLNSIDSIRYIHYRITNRR